MWTTARQELRARARAGEPPRRPEVRRVVVVCDVEDVVGVLRVAGAAGTTSARWVTAGAARGAGMCGGRTPARPAAASPTASPPAAIPIADAPRRPPSPPALGARPRPRAPKRPVADRLLDEAPGEGGHCHAGDHLCERPQRSHAVAARRRAEHDDRLVPQVDAVGAGTHPPQRSGPEHAGQPARRMRARGDHQDGGQRQQDKASVVEKRPVLAGAPHHDGDRRQPQGAQPVDDPPRPIGDPRGQGAARPHHGQRGAEQQAEGAGVRTVVDTRGVKARVVEDRHLDRRGGGQRQGDAGQPRSHRDRPPALADHPDPDHQQPRPHDVELLLDGQRPQVVQRRGRTELLEVGDVVEDLPPVVDVEQGRDHLAPGVAQPGVRRDRHPQRDDDEHQIEGGQQAARAARPEVGQPPAPTVPRGQQQIGDQIAAEGEEHPHAEQTAGRPAEAEVVGDDRGDGESPDPVQRRHVSRRTLNGLWHSGAMVGPPRPWSCQIPFTPGAVAPPAPGPQPQAEHAATVALLHTEAARCRRPVADERHDELPSPRGHPSRGPASRRSRAPGPWSTPPRGAARPPRRGGAGARAAGRPSATGRAAARSPATRRRPRDPRRRDGRRRPPRHRRPPRGPSRRGPAGRRDVVQREARDRAVKGAIGEREGGGVADGEERVADPGRARLTPRDLDHRRRHINALNLGDLAAPSAG